MRVRLLFLAALGVAIGAASASPLPDYLKARKKYAITQATTSLALDTVVGEAVMEVRATIRGSFTIDGKTSILLEVAGADPIVVKSASIPQWLTNPQAEARLLIRARRLNEFSVLEAELLDATDEQGISAWERAQAAAHKASGRSQLKNTRLPAAAATRGAARTWNMEPHSAVPVYAQFIKSYNRRLSDAQATEISNGIIGFSIQYGVDARLIMAMVLVESGFNPGATSHTGAMGLGQLMPGTAAGMGVRNAYNTYDNLYGTVRLIRGHLDKYAARSSSSYENLVLALAAYNAGSGAVKRHGGVPPYRETQNYIKKVTEWYRILSGA